MTDIQKLVDKLKECDYHYTLGNPIITDKEYDTLREQLQKLDPKNKYIVLLFWICCYSVDHYSILYVLHIGTLCLFFIRPVYKH